MKIIEHPELPKPVGHYSPVIEHNGLLYISGQLPKNEDGSIPDGIEAQTELVLKKLDQLLQYSGSRKDRVLQVRIYIPDVALWDAVNQVYAGYFQDHRPARCIVPSRDLHFGCLLELEATAAVL